MTKLARLFFDIETTVDYEAALMLPEPRPPKNYKDPAKIEAWVADKRVQQVEKAALDPHTGRIVALGWATNPHGDIETTLARTGDEVTDEAEIALLDRFWDLLQWTEGRCVGYNIIPFDLPYLLVRSFALGVDKPEVLPELGKYRDDPTTDLFGVLSNWSWDGAKSLKWIAERYKLTVAAPAVDGSMIDQLSDKQLGEYVASDVGLVQQLYVGMEGYFFNHE